MCGAKKQLVVKMVQALSKSKILNAGSNNLRQQRKFRGKADVRKMDALPSVKIFAMGLSCLCRLRWWIIFELAQSKTPSALLSQSSAKGKKLAAITCLVVS